MELEHMFQQSNVFTILQLMFMGSLLIPSVLGRTDLYGKVARAVAINVVSFGPIAILVYVLYEVSLLN